MKTIFALAAALVLLTGCATLSREQCRQGDWFGIGMADGRDGQPTSRMDQHFKACAEYGIMLNDQQYLDGRAQGLVEYCRLDNAFDTGLRGQLYQHVCPADIDATFAHYNRAAYEVYRLRRDLDNIESRIDDLESRLRSRDVSDDYRHDLKHELRDLDRQYYRLRDNLFASERDLEYLMNEARQQRMR